jgi:hypothetical protein
MKLLIVLLPLLIVLTFLPSASKETTPPPRTPLWQIRSIDTMKNSRDMARAEKDEQDLPERIDKQMQQIASTGANFVAIDTPYDDEFVPVLKQWVNGAREHHLSVWFRGNWSGWEGWFGYPKMSAKEHLQKTQQFILSHPDLFADGDIFTSCPECENGSLGDPRSTHQVAAYRRFLIDEYNINKEAFAKIGVRVDANYLSMNGDVALLVMDKPTTKALGGIVVIDHYVKTADQLATDVAYLAKSSGGKIVLGEIGAPIPDIHGNMTEKEQAEWLTDSLSKVSKLPEVLGLNYWVNMGGSTALWDDQGRAKPAVRALTTYYQKQRTISPTPTPRTRTVMQTITDQIVAFVKHLFTRNR